MYLLLCMYRENYLSHRRNALAAGAVEAVKTLDAYLGRLEPELGPGSTYFVRRERRAGVAARQARRGEDRLVLAEPGVVDHRVGRPGRRGAAEEGRG